MGVIFDFDQSRFDDMVKYPEAYDLGWDLQSRMPKMTDERAEAINEGAKLTEVELEETKGIVNDIQDQGEGGTNCSGFTLNFDSATTCFAAFTGSIYTTSPFADIDYEFYKLFTDKKSAEEHLMTLGDRWLVV